MIDYSPFWLTLQNSEETTYTLIHKHHISGSTLDRLRKNLPLSTVTINDLCRILDCDISDIARYIRSDDEQKL
ncbi:helix-turn-helix domain-containing protein [Luxibacter massiliensis]|uniref:helix-turn-helix domain-containing protein n=1 Tax=Luxibacter massiliensis TaxID=2219695 RepID=UPI000F0582E3|nr:helix-turn-helix transcriptional regulator [Luxibacter massiliensis]